ncbi:hypothetical protein [Streptomyces sp. NPDC001315]|uniref:hypothetical protein n=1 Tax=Streptomyces sp. NPDC001315 TaxID=3364562 RepID=UPI0036BF7AA4
MLGTVLLGFAAGFRAGNGLPCYVAGSTGERTSPGPFRPSALTHVVSGWTMLLVAAVCRHFADTASHPLPAYTAAAAGVLAVGLVHARLWRADPWGTARRGTTSSAARGGGVGSFEDSWISFSSGGTTAWPRP